MISSWMRRRSSAREPISTQWRDLGFDVNLGDLFYTGERKPVVDYLSAHGWQSSARTRSQVFEGYGRVFPDAEVLASMRNSLSVIATRK